MTLEELVALLESANPDGMTDEDIDGICNVDRAVYAAACDILAVPDTHEHRQLYLDYCWEKQCAMACRKSGCIAAALRYERNAERIYRSMPKESRW